jgi:hypothetical protein
MRNALSYTIVFVCLTMPATAVRAQEPFVAVHDFHITEGGGVLPPLGAACSIDVKGARAALTILDDQWTAKGGNHLISGRVLQHKGDSEEWRGIFDAIKGYEVCSAELNYADMSISGESTFNVKIRRAPFEFRGSFYKGLIFYAVVPKDRPERHWINATFAIRYVPAGTADQYDCQADGSYPWLCKGQNCNPLTRW